MKPSWQLTNTRKAKTMPEQPLDTSTLPVVAWCDDGSHVGEVRVVLDSTRRNFPAAAVRAYSLPLVRLEDARAMAEELVRTVLEQAVRLCEAERAEHMEQAGRNDGRQSDMAFGSVNSAERIAEAIRGLAGPPNPMENKV